MKPCALCKIETDSFSRHPNLPRSTDGEPVDCCGGCAAMMQIVFGELYEMYIEEVLQSGAIQRYIKNKTMAGGGLWVNGGRLESTME